MSSPKGSITYQEIINLVYNYLVGSNGCMNVGNNYNNLHAAFKSNTRANFTAIGSFTAASNSFGTLYYIAQSNGSLGQVATSTVQSQLNALCTSSGISSGQMNYNVDDKSFLPFLSNIRLFLVTKIEYIVASWLGGTGTTSASDRFKVYIDNAIPTGSLLTITPSSTATDITIKAPDVVNQVNALLNNIKVGRVWAIGYSYNIGVNI